MVPFPEYVAPELTQFSTLFDVQPPRMLYHYTSTDAFVKIIQSGQIHMSDACATNDYLECRLVRHWVASLEKEHQTPSATKFFEMFWSMYRLWRGYIASFSTEKDTLSQWRAYADDGRGVAIGLNTTTSELAVIPHMNVNTPEGISCSKIRYCDLYKEDNQFERLVHSFVRKGLDYEDHGVASSFLADILFRLGTVFKNDAFDEEQEWRLINISTTIVQTDKLHVRAAKDRICPYMAYTFPSRANVLNEVVLGPKNNCDREDVMLFVRNEGYTNFMVCQISKSLASYR
jgi:Protein of unknown function (DUF2971)